MTIDKNQAVIDWLTQCPAISTNPLFFNFINAKDDNKQIITLSNDKSIQRPYIDGSVLKRYTFSLIDFKTSTTNAIVKMAGYVNENVDEMLQVQDIIDWINEQADNANYPDFGENCIIENLETLTDNPNLNGIDTSVTPALARYSVTIRITYLDITKVIWNK